MNTDILDARQITQKNKRRNHYRFPCDAQATLTGADQNASFQGRVVNASPMGLFVETAGEQPLTQNEPVAITWTPLPQLNGTGAPKPCTIRGVVTHVSSG